MEITEQISLNSYPKVSVPLTTTVNFKLKELFDTEIKNSSYKEALELGLTIMLAEKEIIAYPKLQLSIKLSNALARIQELSQTIENLENGRTNNTNSTRLN